MGTANKFRLACVAIVAMFQIQATAQVVRIAPIVTSTPTADVDAILPGVDPPVSTTLVDGLSPIYVEIWATNIGAPLNGLACVHVDLFYDRTDLLDVVPPSQVAANFLITAVPAVFDDPGGIVGDIGGCQPIPVVNGLGVDEWVLVHRVQFAAIGGGGPITFTLTDANNFFAGTTIIGELTDVDPADIAFDNAVLQIGGCAGDGDCDDGNDCTTDTCAGGTCTNTDSTPAAHGQVSDAIAFKL